MTVVAYCCLCSLLCLSDLLRAVHQQRQQCYLSRTLTGNVGQAVQHIWAPVSHGSASRALAGQWYKGQFAHLLLVCHIKMEHHVKLFLRKSSETEISEVEVKVTTLPCFPLAAYRVMFHQNEKRTLKYRPLSLIGDSFPFRVQ